MAAIIHPYKSGSKSAKALAEALGWKQMKREGSKYKGNLIVNWGASEMDGVYDAYILNPPSQIRMFSNKLTTFQQLTGRGVPMPGFTTDKEEAASWFEKKGTKVVVCRTLLNGHSGAGIVLADSPKKLVDAPLYTTYFPKKFEFRVHFFRAFGGGMETFIQQKRRKLDVPDDQVNWQVRNHQNGFIYSHQDLDPIIHKVMDDGLYQLLIDGIGRDLHFGGVDVVVKSNGEWSVLEVNTACGLEGTTVGFYAKCLKAAEIQFQTLVNIHGLAAVQKALSIDKDYRDRQYQLRKQEGFEAVHRHEDEVDDIFDRRDEEDDDDDF